MARHFAEVAMSTGKGKALVSIWGAGLVVCAVAAYRKAQAKGGPREPSTRKKKKATSSLSALLKPLLRVAFPSVFEKTTGHLIAYTVLLGARIMLTIQIAKITGSLAKTVGARSFDEMFNLQVIFGLWCMPAAIVNSFLAMESSAVRQLIYYTHHILT